MRQFIPNFAEIVRPISDMLKMGHDLKWSDEAKREFMDIKQTLCQSPVLANPDYGKIFQLFSFASTLTMVVVILQKNNEDMEQPITFMSKDFQGSELNYELMEKQAYALVKSLGHFRDYFWNAIVIAYVPHPMVKNILVQKECIGTRGRWITKIQEYNLKIKPTKLIRGQGLAKMMAERSLDAIQDIQVEEHVNSLSSSLEHCDWYSDIIFYLKNLSCPSLTLIRRRGNLYSFGLQSNCFVRGGLGWRNPNGLIFALCGL
jgi:hypothetical protein